MVNSCIIATFLILTLTPMFSSTAPPREGAQNPKFKKILLFWDNANKCTPKVDKTKFYNSLPKPKKYTICKSTNNLLRKDEPFNKYGELNYNFYCMMDNSVRGYYDGDSDASEDGVSTGNEEAYMRRSMKISDADLEDMKTKCGLYVNDYKCRINISIPLPATDNKLSDEEQAYAINLIEGSEILKSVEDNSMYNQSESKVFNYKFDRNTNDVELSIKDTPSEQAEVVHESEKKVSETAESVKKEVVVTTMEHMTLNTESTKSEQELQSEIVVNNVVTESSAEKPVPVDPPQPEITSQEPAVTNEVKEITIEKQTVITDSAQPVQKLSVDAITNEIKKSLTEKQVTVTESTTNVTTTNEVKVIIIDKQEAFTDQAETEQKLPVVNVPNEAAPSAVETTPVSTDAVQSEQNVQNTVVTTEVNVTSIEKQTISTDSAETEQKLPAVDVPNEATPSAVETTPVSTDAVQSEQNVQNTVVTNEVNVTSIEKQTISTDSAETEQKLPAVEKPTTSTEASESYSKVHISTVTNEVITSTVEKQSVTSDSGQSERNSAAAVAGGNAASEANTIKIERPIIFTDSAISEVRSGGHEGTNYIIAESAQSAGRMPSVSVIYDAILISIDNPRLTANPGMSSCRQEHSACESNQNTKRVIVTRL